MSFIEELKRRNVFRVGIAYGVATWLLIQVTDIVFPRIGLPDSAVTLVIALLGIGFIPALIFAWAFEMTPEGIKRESDIEREESTTPKTAKKLDRVIIAGLVLIIAGMGVERFFFANQAAKPATAQTETASKQALDQDKTIAVLPFADMSEGQDQAWFSDGLAEEILNALARAPDLLVSSRTSSFGYKGSNTPISQIASELGVAHVLEGSVRRAGDRIRVTAQLIRASDGFHLWSENYDRNADDVILIQEELAVSIANALKTTMDPAALQQMLQSGTRSVEAFEHYLSGLSLSARSWEEPGWDSFIKGYEAFEKARKVDPGFSYAHYHAAIFWFNQISISRRPSGLVDASPAEKMTAFRERIGAAINTAGNDTDRMKFEALLAQVEVRLRDAISLGLQVMEARPYDVKIGEHLLEVTQDAQDLETQQRVLLHARNLWQNGPDWLRIAISAAWRLEFAGGNTGFDSVEFIRETMRQSRKISPAYQAHRALLWYGELEAATEMLPYLANETSVARVLIDFRQACAEGRRSDAERILRNIPNDWNEEHRASTLWHLYQMLGEHEKAAEVLKPYESFESPLTVGAYLGYPDFDPTPFPVLMSIMQREGIKRHEPPEIPFACPDQDVIQQESVAVLPFTSMSSGEDDGYFADGLTEEILNSLAALPELLVTARTSSFHFKGQNIPVPEIAAKLGVDHVVEGSVRRAGDRVRITAQLIRASDGFHLWSDTYDRTLEDVFAVQEDIAGNIAETLDVVLNEDKRALLRSTGIRDVNAFIAYQKGLAAFATAHENISSVSVDLEVAVRHFDQALAVSPDLVGARIMKADQKGHILFELASGLRNEAFDGELVQTLEELREEYRLAIDASPPGNQRDILYFEAGIFSDDWTDLKLKLRRALQPGSCPSLNWTPDFAITMSHAKELIGKLKEQLVCDPMGIVGVYGLTGAYLHTGRPHESMQMVDEAAARGTPLLFVDDLRFLAHLAAGNLDAPEVQGHGPGDALLPYSRQIPRLLLMGDTEAALKLAQPILDDPGTSDWAAMLVAAIVGDRERANHHAALIDARPGSTIALTNAALVCACGAPFDLEATPNLKARMEVAEFDWPPPTAIQYPDKDW